VYYYHQSVGEFFLTEMAEIFSFDLLYILVENKKGTFSKKRKKFHREHARDRVCPKTRHGASRGQEYGKLILEPESVEHCIATLDNYTMAMEHMYVLSLPYIPLSNIFQSKALYRRRQHLPRIWGSPQDEPAIASHCQYLTRFFW